MAAQKPPAMPNCGRWSLTTTPHPWSAALAGKRVLVVHPFKTTIERQYARREQLFPGTDILPQFADLRIVQAVQGPGRGRHRLRQLV